MADFVEKWGDDVESAVELALLELNLTRDEVEVTVLEQPSRGFLGLFGHRLAKVRVQKKSGKFERSAASADKKPDAVKQVTDIGASNLGNDARVKKESDINSDQTDGEEQTEPGRMAYANGDVSVGETEKQITFGETGSAVKEMGTGDVGRDSIASADIHEVNFLSKEREVSKKRHRSSQINTKFTVTADEPGAEPADDAAAVKFVEEIAEAMNLKIGIKAFLKNDVLFISLEGKDVGSLIGKRGQTLDAIQYLASIVQNKNSETHNRVVINAERYREKREKTLQQLARRLADKCVKSGKSVRLEPMNPYERKVIHSTLQSHPKVTTRSEGAEPNRRVVIELKK